MKSRKVVKWVLALSVILLLSMGVVWMRAWRSPPYYTEYGNIELPLPIMMADEYRLPHPEPFVVEIQVRDGALLLYGAKHTKDPNDSQIADIQRRWTRFRPTVALVESRLGFFIDGLSNPVLKYGESGAVFSLARKHGVKAYTWEPPRERQVALVLRVYPKERVALFYVLRPYFGNLRYGRPDDPDGFVEAYRRQRTKWPGLENTITSIADIDAIWQRDFPGAEDWRETSDEYGLLGYLSEIAKTSNAARDEHFARVLIDLASKGERVFAVAGSSHSVKLEPALRGYFESNKRGGH